MNPQGLSPQGIGPMLLAFSAGAGLPHMVASFEKIMKLMNPQAAGAGGKAGKQATGPQGAGMPMATPPMPGAGGPQQPQLDPRMMQLIAAIMQARRGTMG